MKISAKVYDWVFWISLTVIAVWIVLKAVGVINSPTWQELLPFAGAIFAAGAFFQKVNNIERRLQYIDGDTRQLKVDMGIMKNKLSLKNHQS